MNKQIRLLIGLIFVCKLSYAQIDLECNGRDMHSIYILRTVSWDIYRIDSVDTNPTNPILVSSTINTINASGISINDNLDSLMSSETMYVCGWNPLSGPPAYFFWNGTGWANTYHNSGSINAINPGGTADYIFNLDVYGNSLYRYDGTGNGTLLLSNLNTSSPNNTIYDIATDNTGNFYILYSSQQKTVSYSPAGIAIDTFTTTGMTSDGAGLAILGNRIYAVKNSDLFEGIITGNNINFTWIKNIGFNVGDIASCPNAANPISNENPVDVNNFFTVNSNVYPNPFNDKLKINVSTNEPLEFVLQDLTGRQIFQQSFTNSISINTEQIANGIYLYEVRKKSETIKKGKVIKN